MSFNKNGSETDFSKEYKKRRELRNRMIADKSIVKYSQGKSGETAFEALTRFVNYIDTFGHAYFVNPNTPIKGIDVINFSKTVSISEVEAVEKVLSIKLSPSYVKFITTYGLINIDKRFNLMMSPNEALEITESIYRIEEKIKSEKELKELKKLFFFQDNPYPGNYFAFNTEFVNQNGEMGITRYYHDDEFFIDENFVSFDDHISLLVNNHIFDDLEEIN